MSAGKKLGGAARRQSKTPPAMSKPVAEAGSNGTENSAGHGDVKKKRPADRMLSPADLIASPAFQELVREAFTIAAAEIGRQAPAAASPKKAGQWATPRQRAAALRARMAEFRAIYNAGWYIRNYMHGDPDRMAAAAAQFCDVVAAEIARATDKEALIYAIADTLTCSPYGVPWAG